MNKIALSIADIPHFSDFIKSYVQDDERLRDFYSFRPEIDAFEKAIEGKKKANIDRDLLVTCLQDQYKNVSTSDLVQQNILSLKEEQTFTVTTGHQLCSFTGPLYFIYKIVSTINLAQQLKERYPENHFVPVFWMASEDHDFEEVNHVHLFGKKYSWEEQSGGPVGRMHLAKLKEVLQTIRGDLEGGEEVETLFKLLSAYTDQENLAGATRYLVNELFGDKGLLIIDGDDASLKAQFLEVMEGDILENGNIQKVNEAVEDLLVKELLSKKKVQVHARPINVFYMNDELRSRIEQEGEEYKVLGTDKVFTEITLKEELSKYPERFSPNVVLRPLYQEMILPNLAYIGGAGEVSYWLELKKMFDQQQVQFPVLLLRNSVLLMDAEAVEHFNKLSIDLLDLFASEDELIASVIKGRKEEELLGLISDLLEELNEAPPAELNENDLKVWKEVQEKKSLKAIKQLEKKFVREEKKKEEDLVKRVQQFRAKLFPDNTLQERYDNFIPHYLLKGEDFLDHLYKNLDPLSADFTVLLLA